MGCTSLSSSRGPMEFDFDETHRTDLDTPGLVFVVGWQFLLNELVEQENAFAVFMMFPSAFGKSRLRNPIPLWS